MAEATPTVDDEMEVTADVEMEETVAPAVDTPTDGDSGATAEGAAAEEAGEAPMKEAEPEAAEPKRIGFTAYLRSPVVTLQVGEGDETTSLTVYQALLVQSLYFAERCATLANEPWTIALAHHHLDAVGCFLEYLYTGDYFPRKVAGHAHQLEADPGMPTVDETGEQLLKHARVYTLAGQLAMPALQALASSKIHCVHSTAKGEIAYARYVYEYTAADDKSVRNPVARFWATRSHTLRAEAEAEFQALCLEFPQFAYDVLTRVLDEKLKRERDDRPHSAVGSARKRARNSGL